jgi:hypothetical protein
MFDSKKSLPARAADALDLMIEFATLGEYGLEYPEDTRHAKRTSAACSRTLPPGSTGDCERRRVTVRTPSTTCKRAIGPRTTERGRATSCAEPLDYRAALRTPRIRLSFND